MKKCSKCNTVKSLSSFDYHKAQCKSCRNEIRAARPKKKYPVSVLEKTCRCCGEIKLTNQFNIDSSRLDGLTVYCNGCRALKNQKHYTKNPEPAKLRSKSKYSKVRGTEEFKAYNRSRQNIRESTDIFFKLKRRLRNRLYYAILNTEWKKNSKFSDYIGCNRELLISHIESQFTEGMSWENYGQWHIDHIVPLASAISEEQLYKLCHYSNLQPLWGEENIKKGSKINK